MRSKNHIALVVISICLSAGTGAAQSRIQKTSPLVADAEYDARLF